MEMKVELDNIESLIERRSEKKLKEDPDIIKINRQSMLEKLEAIKEEMKKQHKKSVKLWKEAILSYTEFVKKQALSRKINPPPEKPCMPYHMDTIEGYIKLFECMIDEEILLRLPFLKEIFVIGEDGLAQTRNSINEMQAYTSGSAYFAMSDMSLSPGEGIYNG